MKLTNHDGKMRELVIPALLALLSTLALCCKVCIVPGTETESFAVSFLSKLVRSFPGVDLTDLVLFPALFVFYRYVSRRCPERDGWALVLSGLFALLFVLSRSFEELDSIGFFNDNKFQLFISLFCVAGFWALFYPAVKLVFAVMSESTAGDAPSQAELKRLWLRGFIVILLCWLPWTFANYPGSISGDVAYQLLQSLGYATWNTHHPPLSSAIIGLCVRIGRSIWNPNFGFFLYILFQTVLGAAVFSYGVRKLREYGFSIRLCVAVLLSFALSPMWGAYSQWLEKSLLYTELAALSVFFAMDIISRRECSVRDGVRIAAVIALASLLRNNGIYELAPLLVALVFYLRKADRRRCLAALLAVLAIYGGVTKALYPALGMTKGSVAEALSIPFQQTARYVVTYPEDVTEYEHDVIDSVLTYYNMEEKYNPELSDQIKAGYREDGSKLPEYFKVWFQMLLKHPGVYFSAFYNMGYGVLAPVSSGERVKMMSTQLNIYTDMGFVKNVEGANVFFLEQLSSLTVEIPVIKYVSYPGAYTWLLLSCAVLLLKRKQVPALIALIPGFMNLLVCLASPIPCEMRYMTPLAATIPVILGWTAYNCSRFKNGKIILAEMK